MCQSNLLGGDPGMFGKPTAAHAGNGCCTPGAIWTAQMLVPALLGMEPAGKLLLVPPKLGMTFVLTELTLLIQSSPARER